MAKKSSGRGGSSSGILQYSDVFADAPIGVFTINRRGEITSVNQEYVRISGAKSKKQLLGLNVLKRPPERRADVSRYLRGGLKGEPFHVHNIKHTSLVSGGVTTRFYGGIPIKNDRGVVEQLLVLVDDITEQEKKAEDVRRQKDFSEKIIGSSPIGIFTVNKEGIITSANPAYLDITGVEDAKQIVGDSVLTRPSYKKSGVVKYFRDCLKGKAFDVDNITHTATFSGKTTVRRYMGIPIKDKKGKTEQLLVLVEDVTERRKAQEEYKNLLEHALDGIFKVDITGKLTYVNPALRKMTGYSKAAIGTHVTKYVTPQMIPKALKLFHNTIKGRESHYIEFNIKRKDGSVVPAEVSTSTLIVEGCVVGGMGIVRDITERRKAEEALRKSERRFKDITENALEWIWEVNTNGRYTYASQIVKEILGYEPEEILDKHFYDLFHPEDREELTKAAFEVLAKKQPFREFINRNVHKNGKTVWLLTSGTPIHDEKGNLRGYRGADTDITDRKRAEEALKEGEERYRVLFESANDAVFTADIETGRLLYFNKQAENLTGRSRKELTGMHQSKLHPPDKAEYYKKVFRDHIKNGSAVDIEAIVQKKDGTQVPVLINANVIDLAGKKVIQGIFRDITEIKKAEEIIKQKLRELKELDVVKDEYFYSISHELKTPLTSITALTQTLLTEKLGAVTDQQREVFEIILDDSKRLMRSVQKVLDLATIESGKIVYEKEEVRFCDVVADTVISLKHLAEGKGIELDIDVPKDLKTVQADKKRLVLVVDNLISNSLKFTSEGGRVSVSAKGEDECILVSVSDTGIGIPPEHIGKVFEKFYRIENPEVEDRWGTGLGLVICKRIIEDHAGKIWVESNVGEGTTFFFTLPFKGDKG